MRRWAILVGLAGATLAATPPGVHGQEAYEADPSVIAPGGYVIFLRASGPLSYATLTPRDAPPGAVTQGSVKGSSCQYGVAVPVSGSVSGTRVSGGAGEGGFDRALSDILDRHPDLKGIYDVKVDTHTLRVLSFFQRLCIEITALGFR